MTTRVVWGTGVQGCEPQRWREHEVGWEWE